MWPSLVNAIAHRKVNGNAHCNVHGNVHSNVHCQGSHLQDRMRNVSTRERVDTPLPGIRWPAAPSRRAAFPG